MSHPLASAKAFGDHVIVRRDRQEEMTPGGIALPDTAKNRKTQTGVVVSVGPGMYFNSLHPITGEQVLLKMRVREKQRVVFNAYGGQTYGGPTMKRDDEDEYVILREHEILAVL